MIISMETLLIYNINHNMPMLKTVKQDKQHGDSVHNLRETSTEQSHKSKSEVTLNLAVPENH